MKSKLILPILLLLLSVHLNAQEDERIFMSAEENPSFPGGMKGLVTYLQENIQYPQKAKEAGIQGMVHVKFVVRKDGSVDNAKVLKGIGAGCDEEAIRLISEGPNWKPGNNFGKPVNVLMTIPIQFKVTERVIQKKVAGKSSTLGFEDMLKNKVKEDVSVMEGRVMDEDKEKVYEKADIMPDFPGGYRAFLEYIDNNMKYPDNAQQIGIQGKVHVKFTILKDGSMNNVEVIKELEGGCSEEALRLMENSPKWNPGIIDGQPVNVRFTVPINFQLN